MSSFVDLRTGKIIGCEKNSPVWWHEKGHIEFSKSDRAIRFEFMTFYYLVGAVFLLIGHAFFQNVFIRGLALFCIVRVIAYYVFEEGWCWLYALKKRKKWKKK